MLAKFCTRSKMGKSVSILAAGIILLNNLIFIYWVAIDGHCLNRDTDLVNSYPYFLVIKSTLIASRTY